MTNTTEIYRKKVAQPTEAGAALCERYRAIREKCLIEHLTTGEEENRRLVELARALRKISGDYDAAARAATTNRP